MIHDPTIEVTCDGIHVGKQTARPCGDSVILDLDYTYNSYSGESGQYDTSDSAIERKLKSKGWLVRDGKHYCCYHCAGEEET